MSSRRRSDRIRRLAAVPVSAAASRIQPWNATWADTVPPVATAEQGATVAALPVTALAPAGEAVMAAPGVQAEAAARGCCRSRRRQRRHGRTGSRRRNRGCWR